MRASINGEERDVRRGTTLFDLLQQLGIAMRGVAVARNDRVIGRAQLADEQIEEGDRIEIIRAVAGG
ncbi:MAG: sulfur carrier protein ThiS [Candidatus Eremiobacteraeota bacterium]|nr:sulfur carrier protein ThiS [Candidatus Eremiobacteraeota bacterium]